MRRIRTVAAPMMVVGVCVAALAGCATDAPKSSPTPSPAPTGVTSSAPPASSPANPSRTAKAPTAPAGPITISSPGPNAVVGRTFTVKGTSRTFEGNLVWKLMQSENTVRFGTAKGGSTTVAPFSFNVTAPASGQYSIIVLEESAKDGGPLNQTEVAITVN